MEQRGKISLVSAVLMSINIIVGVGIYFGPQLMAGKAGSLSFLGWLLVGLLMFPIIWSVAIASRLFPGSGFYSYGTQGLGQTAGFMAAWGYLLGFTATAAVQSVVFREVLWSQIPMPFFEHHPILFDACLITLLSALNLLAVEWISKVQSVATVLKLMPLFFVIAMIPFYWNSSIEYHASDLSLLGATIPMALFGFWGFESCCSIAEYLEGGPSKAFGVILTAFFTVAILYSGFHFGLIHIMGPVALASAGVQVFPQFMGIKSLTLLSMLQGGFTIALIINFMNAIYGVMLTNICNLHSLVQKDFVIFSSSLSRVNKFQRPSIIVLIQAVAVLCLMTLVPEKEKLIAITNLGVITAFIITLVAVLRAQFNKKDYFQIFMTLCGFFSCSVLMYFTWTKYMKGSIIYSLPLVIGLVLGYIMYRSRRSTAEQRA